MKTHVRRLRKREVNEGVPHPCGATWDGEGTNFAIFSGNATGVELCLFNEDGNRELERIELLAATSIASFKMLKSPSHTLSYCTCALPAKLMSFQDPIPPPNTQERMAAFNRDTAPGAS